ncbi:hypothetical protein AWN90_24730 [Nocardia terpenica]|uniref:Uncharacterized protein n=1 Tax=Nocardia terpenica TaxID=455432 RepID=A0A164NFI0_9NOCA|nr:hypothetical protein AWN90_24730 [Nocardia terpenica]
MLRALTDAPDACTAAELAHLTGLPLTDASDIEGRAKPSIPAILEALQDAAPDNPAAAELKLTGNRIRALVAIGNAEWPRTPRGFAETTGTTRSAMTAAVNWLVYHRSAWLRDETTWEPVPGIREPADKPW